MYLCYLYLEKSRLPGNWLLWSGPPKKRTTQNLKKLRKIVRLTQNQRKKEWRKKCPDILIAVVFRIFSRYDINMYILYNTAEIQIWYFYRWNIT